jgi:hypothetical protein
VATCARQELAGPLLPPPASLHDRRDQHPYDSTILARFHRVARPWAMARRHTATPTSPQGVKENFFFDIVMRLVKKEADKEKLGELLADAAHEGRVRVKPADEKKTRIGRRPNEPGDVEMLREIRAQNPKSEGWTKFRKRLTAPSDRGKQVAVATARRRYVRAAAILAK